MFVRDDVRNGRDIYATLSRLMLAMMRVGFVALALPHKTGFCFIMDQ